MQIVKKKDSDFTKIFVYTGDSRKVILVWKQ